MNAAEILLAGPYNFLYALGFGVAVAVSAWQGRRRGWPMLPLLALLTVCVAGGIAGSKLLHFDLHAAAPGEKTILGGLTGGLIALLLTSRLLPFHLPASQLLAPSAMVGFAIGRLGCFLAGCCFGMPTALPWGVSYGPGTRPFEAQVATGLIEPDAVTTLPIHPTQLYEAGLALLLAYGLARCSGRIRQPGGPAVLMAIGYGTIRFGIEFVRHGEAGNVYLGLELVQWTLLIVLLAGIGILVWRERACASTARGTVTDLARVVPVPAPPVRVGALMLGIVALTIAGWGWLTPLERVVLLASSLPVGVVVLRTLVPRSAWPLTPGSAGAALLFVQLPIDSFPGYPRSFYTIGGGATSGTYERVNDLSPGEDCGPSEVNEYAFQMFGVSLGYTRFTTPRESFGARLRAFVGHNRLERVNGTPHGEEERVAGGSLSATVHTSPFALTGGFITGDLVRSDGNVRGGTDFLGGVRVGAPRGFFGELQYNDHDPMPNPNTRWKVSVGHGFRDDGSNVRVGAFGGGVFLGGRYVSNGGSRWSLFSGSSLKTPTSGD